ncbi:hypothetical protein BGZ65_005348 [Modicella reniformis]|uniref:Uncharacterized protein n=1 Tax=Modicella reniformis TaxID=1440133 RepID=A0A9P6MBI6_9FUNG|nr:hypothetical protein BGZ65_005348 [Modicella reniformis]
MDDSEMQKLWKLTNDLTAQLVFNRNATLELKQQLAALQARTTGHAPVMAISDHSDHSIDHAEYNLRIANERLREENSQLQEQVREYERWMEFIMSKFRLQNFAMAQSRKESMQEVYKMAEQGGEAAMRLQEENAMLQTRLSDLGAVARKAIHEEYYTTEALIESLETENRCLREMLSLAEGDNRAFTRRINPGLGGFFADDEEEENGLHRHRNRVSFPSTSTGSDYELPTSELLQQQQPPQKQQQQWPSRSSRQGQGCRLVLETPVPLSVQTGLLSPTSSSASSTSVPSPSWSPSANSSNSALLSPVLHDSTEQFKSISPPLDDAIGLGSAKQKIHRGKITVNTKVNEGSKENVK